MNKKRRFFIICCMTALLILAITTFLLTGCNRQGRTPNTVQLKPKSAAEVASEKINEYSNSLALLSVYDLNSNIGDPNTVILDARGRSFQVFAASYPAGHVPGSIPILHSEYSHPTYFDRLAPPAVAQKTLSEKGIDNRKRIVLYGNDGLQARIYWMLKLYGCDNQLQILDGGIEKWKGAGFETTGQPPQIQPLQFEFNPSRADANSYTTLEELVDSILKYTPSKIIVDSRPRNEYLAGHIPLSVNISVDDVLNEDKTFKPVQELATLLSRKGVTPDKTVLVYSNNGVRSSLIWYVLHELMGYTNVKNYDAGLSEWTTRELDVEVGEQKLVVKPAQ